MIQSPTALLRCLIAGLFALARHGDNAFKRVNPGYEELNGSFAVYCRSMLDQNSHFREHSARMQYCTFAQGIQFEPHILATWHPFAAQPLA